MDERSLTALVKAFKAGVTPRLEALLDDHAQRFLKRRKIVEPVVWHPPFRLLVGLGFPEPAGVA